MAGIRLLQDFQAECPADAAKFQKLIEKERVYDFLAGLQAEFDPIRVQVLGRDPFPSLREAYAYVQQEESRRNVMIYHPTFEKSAFSSTAASKTIKSIQNKGSDLIDKDHLKCDHCGRSRHTKETCWKLHGRPTRGRGGRSGSGRGYWRSQAYQAEAPDTLHSEGAHVETKGLSHEELLTLRQLMTKLDSIEANSNFIPSTTYATSTSNFALSGTIANALHSNNTSSHSWIIDSGASDHMTGASDHFSSYFPSSGKDKVRIADGSMSGISGKATQKGYKCYHPPTKRVYVTMDVTFRECEAYYNASLHEEKRENDEEVSVKTPIQLWSTQLNLQKEFDVESEEQSGDGTKGSKENVEEENTESEREKQEQIHIDKTARENCGEWQVYTRRRKKHKTIMHSSPSQTVSSSTPVPNALQEPNQEHCEYPSHSFVDPSHSSYPIIDLTHSFDDLDVPIALRKDVRNKSKYPISDFVSYASLSPSYRAFVSSLSSMSIPHNWKEALIDPKWKGAMDEEMRALKKNNTWELVDLPAGKRTVGCKWVFTVKYKADGSVERFKARLVAKGFTQTYGIDYQETFAPVAKLNSVRVLLSCAANLGWDLQQLDVKNAFLHGDLREEVYMEMPPGFSTQKNIGKTSKITILIVYVDDIVITGNDPQEMSKLKCYLAKEFEIKDLGKLRYFLGIEVARSEKGIFISQRKYVLNLLQETGMLGCKPVDSPIEVNHRLQSKIGKEVDKERYQRNFIKENLEKGSLRIPFVKSSDQLADILTKGVGRAVFNNIVYKMGMRNIYAPS
uniref:Reverse transcriptase Ty1/copia-type domain-containing protein n=1 Tax=Ananas comosus var. bracteatus TaxID=296719 RepID=A0A6V7PXW5_ANACO|nr:unnamed protein product [Ananas comosus var. bracteatus]